MPYRSVTSMLYNNGDYPQSVEKAVDLLDLPAVRERQARGEPDGRLIGIGFASSTEQTAHGCGEWITRGVSQIGRASCRERVRQDVYISLVAVFVHKQRYLCPVDYTPLS